MLTASSGLAIKDPTILMSLKISSLNGTLMFSGWAIWTMRPCNYIVQVLTWIWLERNAGVSRFRLTRVTAHAVAAADGASDTLTVASAPSPPVTLFISSKMAALPFLASTTMSAPFFLDSSIAPSEYHNQHQYLFTTCNGTFRRTSSIDANDHQPQSFSKLDAQMSKATATCRAEFSDRALKTHRLGARHFSAEHLVSQYRG